LKQSKAAAGMALDVCIAAVVRDEAKTAQAVAVRLTNFPYKSVLQQLAAKLIKIAEKLHR